MIKTGVCGCDDLVAAELVRALMRHPDVDLRWVSSSHPAGSRLDAIVPGLVGETDMEVVALLPEPLDGVDVVFVCDPSVSFDGELPEGVRIIDLTGNHNVEACVDESSAWTLGMPEMTRRVLVHDCYRAAVPGAAVVATLLALLPLARNLLLNSPVDVRLGVGKVALPALVRGMDAQQWLSQQQHEAIQVLTCCQTSYTQPVDDASSLH